jgi:hypothetical protein
MELYLHASMRLYDTHTEKCISYDTAVPDKTEFISLLHERQTLCDVKTAMLCVREVAGVPRNKHRNTKSVTRSLSLLQWTIFETSSTAGCTVIN